MMILMAGMPSIMWVNKSFIMILIIMMLIYLFQIILLSGQQEYFRILKKF